MTIITSMPAFLSRNYCCTKCNTGYDHKERHKCNNLCHACRKIHDEVAAKWLHCNECRQYFKGRKCFELHLATSTSGNSTCSSIYRYSRCDKTVNRKINQNHQCGQTYCYTCQYFYPEGHQFYLMPEEHVEQEDMSIEEIENAKTSLFFDFGCRQDL